MVKLYAQIITIFVWYESIAIVYTKVSWTFQPDVIRIGETLSLLCTVTGVDSINGGLIRQWTKGSELICCNGHPINPEKYREVKLNGNQFELKINNVTESDLLCKYQCRYGFDTHTKKLEISEHNFENPPAKATRATVYTNASDGIPTIQVHFKKVYPIPNCTITIRGTDIPFKTVKLIKRDDIYYEVYLLTALPNLTNCNDDLEVTCRFIIKYHIPVEKTVMCKIKSETTTNKEMLVGLLIVLIMVIGSAFLMFWKFLRKRKLKEQTGKAINIEKRKGSRSCDMAITDNTKLDDNFNSLQLGKAIMYEQQKPFLPTDLNKVVV
ncbi:uncharacterized protein [Mytilus edulis]|uniref:uncharacterized protein n=1 Tax=Mytilus edulis TaxID=6550 RepID=UPI0039EFC388